MKYSIKQSSAQPSVTDQLLLRMDPKMAATFNIKQLEALQQALQSRPHTVNIRLTFPGVRSRFYLVVLAGRELRSIYRRRQERTKHPIWTKANTLVFAGILLASSPLLLTLGLLATHHLPNWFTAPAAPTIVPFESDQASCERSGRLWQDDSCWDYQHDPTF